MKTNQKMVVTIPNFGDLAIEHKTHIGSVNDVIAMGNKIRVQEGEKPLRLADILRRRDIWKFILIRDQKIKESKFNKKYASNDYISGCGVTPHPPSDYSIIDKYYNTEKRRVDYKELIKYFPDTIKSKRSTKNQSGGTWAELHVLLKIASMLSTRLEVEIYEIFVSNEILKVRDDGGDDFKELNIYLDKLPDRVGKNNKGIFIQTAIKLREKIFTPEQIKECRDGGINIWNSKYANAHTLAKREEFEKKLIFAIEMGFIDSYEKLKETISKL